MSDTILDQEPEVQEQQIPEIEEPAPEPPKFSGLLSNIFPDGTIEYDGQIGLPENFPLTEAEWAEVSNPGIPTVDPSPLPSYLAFWDALLVSSVYQSIRTQALTNPAVLVACTEFIAAITDAKAGRPNVAAIQACIDYLITAGIFTEAELEQLHNLLTVGNLQHIYSLPRVP